MLSEEFSKEMWDCWRDVSVAYGTFAKKMGVDTSELYVVDALWDEPEGLSQRSICEVCDMGKQTISAICKRLVRAMSWLRTRARQTSASGSWRSPMRDASNGACPSRACASSR